MKSTVQFRDRGAPISGLARRGGVVAGTGVGSASGSNAAASAANGVARLSKAALLLHFDDLVRSASVIRGNSASAERALARALAAAQERARSAEERADALRRELEESRREQRQTQALLMQARADVEEEQLRRRRCEAGARALQVRLHGLCADASELGVAPADVLGDAAGSGGAIGGFGPIDHNSGELLDPEDLDYDNTDEEAAAAAGAGTDSPYCHRHLSPPAPSTPAAASAAVTGARNQRQHLAVPPPTVPQLVVECVREIERRGLREVGLYRVSGSHKQVRQLWDSYAQRQMVPDLSGVEDIHVICGLLKMYLANLPEPLLTHRLWPDFARAAETANTELASATLLTLTPANRDTLVYLLVHLLRIAECPAVQMSVTNLARTLAPSLVGNSCPNPEPLTTISETAVQQSILRQLLSLPSAYYADLLSSMSESGNGCFSQQQQQQRDPSFTASKTPLLRPRLEMPPVGDMRDPKYKEKVNFLREKYRATRKIFFPHPQQK